MNWYIKILGVATTCLVLASAASADSPKVIEKKPVDKEPTTDQEFLVRALACEIAEVKFAEQAAKQAQSDDLKKMADKIQDTHSKIRDSLLEKTKEMKIGVVEGLQPAVRKRWEQLAKLKGADYDRAWVKGLIESNQHAVRMYEKWSTEAKDAGLREIATTALKADRTCMEKAQTLATSLKSER
jgi:putative membrane protein